MTHFHVIVAGFGTAGAVSAIAAAANGASVLVLESTTYPGGTQTGGGVPGFYGRHPYGLTALLDKAAATYSSVHGCSNIEARKAILESEALRNGCHIIYEATIFQVMLKQNTVTGIAWKDADGIHEANASVVIDATADARICIMAGCETTCGRDSDSLCNTFTNSMLLAKGNSAYVANFDAGRIDQYDPENYSRALLESATVHIQENYTLHGEDRHQAAPSDLCGLREGRHIIAEDTLTLKDFFNGKLNDKTDIIAFAHSNIDIHANDVPLESTTFQDWMIAASFWGEELWFPITRGALVPKGLKGIIAAGRHIGVDHDMGQAVRMNDHVGRIGEAAGVTAALMAQTKEADPMALPFRKITEIMPEMDNPLHENQQIWGLSKDEIKSGMASNAPGRAIWSAYRQNLTRELLTWNKDKDTNLKCHSAFALALLGRSEALPDLRNMVSQLDDFTPTTSRKYNHPRGCAAVYLLGRMADTLSIHLLDGILSNQDIQHKYEYHGHAVAALINIGEKHPETIQIVSNILSRISQDKNWCLMARLKGTQVYKPIQQVFINHINHILDKWNMT